MLLAGLKISTDPTAWQFSARQIVPMKRNYLLQRFARGVLGTNNIDNGSSLYYAAARQAFYDSVGFPGITYTLNDLTDRPDPGCRRRTGSLSTANQL